MSENASKVEKAATLGIRRQGREMGQKASFRPDREKEEAQKEEEMKKVKTPMTEEERVDLFGAPGQYQKGSIDRMNHLRYPAEPDDIGYMRGWYARLNSQVHHEDSDYDEIFPVLNALLFSWKAHCLERGWPEPEHLPL